MLKTSKRMYFFHKKNFSQALSPCANSEIFDKLHRNNIEQCFKDETMDIVLMSGIAGAISGASGYLLAEKIHHEEMLHRIYPIYALIIFAVIITGYRLIIP